MAKLSYAIIKPTCPEMDKLFRNVEGAIENIETDDRSGVKDAIGELRACQERDQEIRDEFRQLLQDKCIELESAENQICEFEDQIAGLREELADARKEARETA